MTSHPHVQAAHYGFGAIFPVIVLDPQPRWYRPHHGVPQTTDATDAQILVLRWSGPVNALYGAPAALVDAAHRAPAHLSRGALARFHAALPAALRIVTLPPHTLLGAWSRRPGRGRSHR
ncbi:hypothetical protein [Kitasatospora sp. NPDC088783]|uniref:hypothetical protein n=1 Tax=Kitasatospora sp. NPDC088783 TaxID=3364077 RepID=UPI003815F2D6